MAHVGAGALLLNRRRATPAAVLWTQHAAVWTLAPVFLLQAVATVILGRNAWVTAERLWIAQAAEALGACLAAGALAAMAVRAIHLLRTAEGRGDAYDAAPATDGVLAYAGPRDVRRVSLRGVNLAAIGVAQVVFGLGVLWWCGLALERARAADLWFDAFLAFAGLSAVCHLFAGVRLLARRWNSAGAARATERWAGRSVLPMFLMGAVLSVWAGIAMVRGNDMYAGVALAMGVIVCVTTGVFFLLSLAAARMVRGAGE
jgi:hypothetical protein